ncbi:hypothetical protein MTO96_000042 [Rhipicephalus appendiculatus]
MKIFRSCGFQYPMSASVLRQQRPYSGSSTPRRAVCRCTGHSGSLCFNSSCFPLVSRFRFSKLSSFVPSHALAFERAVPAGAFGCCRFVCVPFQAAAVARAAGRSWFPPERLQLLIGEDGWYDAGYAPRFEELKRQILSQVPKATVTGTVGRKSSFEVEVNSVKVFSKLEKNAFPDFGEVVQKALEASNGKELRAALSCCGSLARSAGGSRFAPKRCTSADRQGWLERSQLRSLLSIVVDEGRKLSFEVEINGVQVFSKLAKNAYPDFAEVVARAVDASQGKAVQPVKGVQK